MLKGNNITQDGQTAWENQEGGFIFPPQHNSSSCALNKAGNATAAYSQADTGCLNKVELHI
jgi:hypothetical protein